MKKIIASLLACVMLVAFAACGIIPEETLIDPVETVPSDEMTSSREDIAPLSPSVRMYDANGNELELYSELVYFTDGMVVGDGALIFMSVSSRLPAIAGEIPLVNFGGTPKIEATAREGVSIRGGETVNVYDENYGVLAERLPLSELWEKGISEWQGKTVYIYFTVLFADETSDYEKRTENGYFVKTVFVDHSDVKIVGAGDEIFGVYSETISNGPADFELAFIDVEDYLPLIADKIPVVTLDETSAIRIKTEAKIIPIWSDVVSVYSEDFSLLAENIAIGTVAERAQNWDDDVLYLYFFVRFEEKDEMGTLKNVVENGYFVKIMLE